MLFIPVITLSFLWIGIEIILFYNYPSLQNLIILIFIFSIFIFSLISLYPFIKLIYPILIDSNKDFLPKKYSLLFFIIIFIYIVVLILYSPFFIPLFMVFTVFSGFASIIELHKGIIDKSILKIILPGFNLFGKLWFVYLFPAILNTYTLISYLLVIFDVIVWFLFLRDHDLFENLKILYKSAKEYRESRRFSKTFAIISILVLLFYLFSWPIYTQFWPFLIIFPPGTIISAITNTESQPIGQLTSIIGWLPLIELCAFIMGIICALIYLYINKGKK